LRDVARSHYIGRVAVEAVSRLAKWRPAGLSALFAGARPDHVGLPGGALAATISRFSVAPVAA
jgi:hypothetical protein